MKLLMTSMIFIIICLTCFHVLPSTAEEKWSGTDETVVRKYANAYGREASAPLINTDQGDLLLFLFALAGALAGFVIGYCWRMLTVEKDRVSGDAKSHKRCSL